MADAWGGSFGTAWADSWNGGLTPPPPPQAGGPGKHKKVLRIREDLEKTRMLRRRMNRIKLIMLTD